MCMDENDESQSPTWVVNQGKINGGTYCFLKYQHQRRIYNPELCKQKDNGGDLEKGSLKGKA